MIWISSSSSQAIISVSPSHVYPVLMLGDNSASENRRSWEYWWWWDSDGDNRIEQTDSIEEDLLDELQWITEVRSWWWIWSRSSRLHQVGQTLLYLLHYVQDLLYLPHHVKFLCVRVSWSDQCVCLVMDLNVNLSWQHPATTNPQTQRLYNQHYYSYSDNHVILAQRE